MKAIVIEDCNDCPYQLDEVYCTKVSRTEANQQPSGTAGARDAALLPHLMGDDGEKIYHAGVIPSWCPRPEYVPQPVLKAMEPATLEEAREAQYVKLGGVRCPICGSGDIEGGDGEFDAGTCGQEISCLNCQSTWTDTYTLDGYLNLEDNRTYDLMYTIAFTIKKVKDKEGETVKASQIRDALLSRLANLEDDELKYEAVEIHEAVAEQ